MDRTICLTNKNKHFYKIPFFLLVFYFIFSSDSLLFLYNSDNRLQTIAEYLLVFIAGIFLFRLFMLRKVKANMLVLIAVEIMLIIVALYHDEFRGGYISKMALFAIGYCFFYLYDSEKFTRAYIDIMTLICAVSVLAFLMAPIILKISFIPTITNIAGYQFKSLLITNIPITNSLRNYGPFTEPSRYQAFINLYLMFLLFGKEKNIKRIVLAIITLATTFSTTGYIVCAALFLAFLLSKKNVNNTTTHKYIKIAVIIVLLLFIGFMISSKEEFIHSINKLEKGQESVSFAARYNSIIANIIIIKNHLIFGTGINQSTNIFMQTVSQISNNKVFVDTNTVLLTFSKFGVFVGMFYAINLFKTAKSITKGISCCILFLTFFLMMSGISLIDSVIFNLIAFYHHRKREA